jgi:hypothetical protein
MFDIMISVQGKEHSGKTSAIAVIAAHLRTLGVEVTVQMVDQLDEKTEHLDVAQARLQTAKVFILESNT